MNRDAAQADWVRGVDEVRHEFEVRGLSIAEWARAHGYSSQLVYQILGGRTRCLRGQSHQIAVHLGLKRGLIGSLRDVEARLEPISSEFRAESCAQEGDAMS
jgi:gp16 family phage-associated protein